MRLRKARFVREILVDGNATQAAIRAGYSPRSAVHSAKRLMQQPAIVAAIARASSEAARRNDVTVDRVLQELARIAFACAADVVRVHRGVVVATDTERLTDDQRAAVSEVAGTEHGIRIRQHDKVKALELLGRYLALFTDRHEVTGQDGGPLVVVQGAK